MPCLAVCLLHFPPTGIRKNMEQKFCPKCPAESTFVASKARIKCPNKIWSKSSFSNVKSLHCSFGIRSCALKTHISPMSAILVAKSPGQRVGWRRKLSKFAGFLQTFPATRNPRKTSAAPQQGIAKPFSIWPGRIASWPVQPFWKILGSSLRCGKGLNNKQTTTKPPSRFNTLYESRQSE